MQLIPLCQSLTALLQLPILLFYNFTVNHVLIRSKLETERETVKRVTISKWDDLFWPNDRLYRCYVLYHHRLEILFHLLSVNMENKYSQHLMTNQYTQTVWLMAEIWCSQEVINKTEEHFSKNYFLNRKTIGENTRYHQQLHFSSKCTVTLCNWHVIKAGARVTRHVLCLWLLTKYETHNRMWEEASWQPVSLSSGTSHHHFLSGQFSAAG